MSTDDPIPPLEEQTKRPIDTALRQQRVRAWYPILDPWWVIGAFVILGAVFVPVGLKIQSLSDESFQLIEYYDAFDDPHPDCGINTTANAGVNCTISMTVTQDLQPPIMVHYLIENFHQNHRNYQRSLDIYQLEGATTQTSIQASLCDPLNIINGIRLNPCGFIANTFFNDVIQLTGGVASDGTGNLVMQEDGIAWASDVQYLYKQPNDFFAEECPACNASCCDDPRFSCTLPARSNQDGLCYAYYYANEDTTQYLYETYPQISPIDGVTDEHFIVWMRVAALPNFRKLYGWINQPIAAGTTLTFDIENNWEVSSFGGKKALVLSKTNVFGGKNEYLGQFYFWGGWFCIIVAVFFAVKQAVRPRVVGDRRYLQYKED